MLELKGVTKVYETGGMVKRALDGVSINFRTSEFVAILGPSGSGKTTLLNIIGGLDHYTDGNLKINEISTNDFKDKDWDSYRNHRIGFVFQSYNLIPHQTVLSNVKLALTLSGISKREAIRRAKRALEEVGLGDQIHKKPNQLSGGQMQRVAIARALVNNPDIILADEPTGALDSETSTQVMEILKEISRQKLVIMVTHNPELAEAYATRIITLKDGKITSDSHRYDGRKNTKLDEKDIKKRQKKTRMSFLTAFGLSLQNLLTKKWRTLLVAFAGSIGIIGIALILSVSTGFQTYIDTIQADTLTSYPLYIQKETGNMTEVLLGSVLDNSAAVEDGLVHENPILTKTLGSITTNDLKRFGQYVNNHYDEISDDVRLMENFYSVEPTIYSVDAAGDLVQLNPSTLFSTLLGDSTLISSYSSMASVYRQYDKTLLEEDMRVVAGRMPEKYNEIVVVLAREGKISDLLTYSLGLRDTEELTKVISKILNNESVELNDEPLTLTYDDLMNIELKLIAADRKYQFNTTYNIYEDMSSDTAYMRQLYDAAEELKIVGVVTPKDDLVTVTSGVAYLPELVTHVIETAKQSEVVKKQLENPTVDIFTNTRFDDETSRALDMDFEDLVSVDTSKLASAFKMDLDTAMISDKVREYVEQIMDETAVDIVPLQEELMQVFKDLTLDFLKTLTEVDPDEVPTMTTGELEEEIDEFIDNYDFSKLEEQYRLPAQQFAEAYGGLMKGLLNSYAEVYAEYYKDQTGEELDPDMVKIPLMNELFEDVLDKYMDSAEVSKTFETISLIVSGFIAKYDLSTKMDGLVQYLISSMTSQIVVDRAQLASAFTLNYSEDELMRIFSTMFSKTEKTLASNLSTLGYQALDDPTYIAFYFNTFEGKTAFMNFIDRYNEMMRSYNQDDAVIEYSDTTGALMTSVKVIVDAVSYILIAFVSISLVVSSMMIGIITYISVYERTKEIGVLRAIGASKRNISSIFNAETFIVGLLSGLIGVGTTYLILPILNLVLAHFTADAPGEIAAILMPGAATILIILSVVLTLIGGIIPARAASKKDPVEALRSE